MNFLDLGIYKPKKELTLNVLEEKLTDEQKNRLIYKVKEKVKDLNMIGLYFKDIDGIDFRLISRTKEEMPDFIFKLEVSGNSFLKTEKYKHFSKESEKNFLLAKCLVMKFLKEELDKTYIDIFKDEYYINSIICDGEKPKTNIEEKLEDISIDLLIPENQLNEPLVNHILNVFSYENQDNERKKWFKKTYINMLAKKYNVGLDIALKKLEHFNFPFDNNYENLDVFKEFTRYEDLDSDIGLYKKQ